MDRSVIRQLGVILSTQQVRDRVLNAKLSLQLIEHGILLLNEFLVHPSEVLIFTFSSLEHHPDGLSVLLKSPLGGLLFDLKYQRLFDLVKVAQGENSLIEILLQRSDVRQPSHRASLIFVGKGARQQVCECAIDFWYRLVISRDLVEES